MGPLHFLKKNGQISVVRDRASHLKDRLGMRTLTVDIEISMAAAISPMVIDSRWRSAKTNARASKLSGIL